MLVSDAGRLLAVVSEGWTRAALPATAEVVLTGGETLTIPVNSYQLALLEPIAFDIDPDTLDELVLSVDGEAVTCRKTGPGTHSCTCNPRSCATVLADTDGQWWLSLTSFATSEADLPSGASVTFTDVDGAPLADTLDVAFNDEVGAVFAYTYSLAEDPSGLDLSGRVSLVGAPNNRGQVKTLAKGTFYGQFSRDEDGDLALAGRDKDAVQARGDILIGGEPVDIELVYDPETGETTGMSPPVLQCATGGGGTYWVIGNTKHL